MTINFLPAHWPAPANVVAGVTTRQGGYSQAPYASLNLAQHVNDDPTIVNTNRATLTQKLALPNEPYWLDQTHSIRVVAAQTTSTTPPNADGSYSHESGVVCTVMTADCLPVLLCSKQGDVVGAAHAGWRGLHAGIIEAVIKAMQVPAAQLLVWLGPAIGPQVYEVGPEVRTEFMAYDPQASFAFQPHRNDRYLANLYLLARQRLQAIGVNAIYGGEYCTYSDHENFFSYRRDGQTGRMASLIYRI